MSFRQYGNGEYVFGFNDPAAAALAAAVGLKPQTLKVSGEPEFTAEAKDEEGMTAAFAVGDDMRNIQLNGFLVDEGLFDGAREFEFDGSFFIVTGRNKDVANTEFKKGDLTARAFSKITGVAS